MSDNIPIDDENRKNDDFLSMLGDSDMNLIPNVEKKTDEKSLAAQEQEKLKAQLADKTFEENLEKPTKKKSKPRASMEEMQAKPVEKTVTEEKPVEKEVVEEPVTTNKVDVEEPKVEDITKAEKPKAPKKKSSAKKVEVISPEAADILENSKADVKKSKIKKTLDVGDVDEFDTKIQENNTPIIKNYDEDNAEDLTLTEVNKIIDESYDRDSSEKSEENVVVEIVADTDTTKDKPEQHFKIDRKAVHEYYGGKDSPDHSFKLRSAKVSKVFRNMQIDDTSSIQSADINGKTAQERQDIYLKTVLPTLQPSLSVVPLIISGVVISMSAFTWPDIQELLKIEDKVADLDPSTRDYFYEKNKLFIEKRRKQLELFYKHITQVSGFDSKPSADELYGKIIKFPDFQQLFFAAYSASFLKDYQFDITCATCGTTNAKMVNSKDLCFLLNSNINIKQLNHYIEHGASLDSSESAKVYREFQDEKLVDMSNSTYRTTTKLPVSSFIYDLKIPTIYEALNSMEEIVETFKEKDLSYTDIESGNTVYIDSSFGLTPELFELRKYLYIDNLIVPRIIDEDKENNTAKVSFVSFKEKPAIINSVYQLSPEDYRTLMNDTNLNKLIKVSGIRHAINAGICEEPTCKSDLGSIPVEPEMLFFIIARQESE